MDKPSRALALSLLSLVACASCSSDPPADTDGGTTGGCDLAFLGDPSAELAMEVVALDGQGELVTLVDGSDVTQVFPPQGGRVVFVGVRATNLDPCNVRVAGAMRDLTSMQVRLDNRTTNLEPTGDGWGRSSPSNISSFSNIPTCPNQWADGDLFDKPYELTISVTDRSGRKATRVMNVVPRCDEPGFEEDCRCICQGGYVLGMSCVDAGAP